MRRLIIENQKKINLIGRGTMDNIWIRHFADSAKIFNIVKNIYTKSNKEPLSFIDVGSGAGFPGVVINTMAEAEKMVIKTYLIDSNKKKCGFLKSIKNELQLSFDVLNERSEDINGKFDIITARAVSSIKEFLDVNHKMMGSRSNLILLKGKTWEQEIKESKKKWNYDFNVVKNNNQLDHRVG